MGTMKPNDFNAGMVKPFVAIAYLATGKVTVIDGSGNLYDHHDWFCCVPIDPLYVHTDPKINFTGANMPLSQSFVLGQYIGGSARLLVPKTPDLDVLTDLVTKVYTYVMDDNPEMAYATLAAFQLMLRIAMTPVHMTGGRHKFDGVRINAF